MRLSEICRAHESGGASFHETGAFKALSFGLMAISNRGFISTEAFDAVYATVEPLIPFGSLGEVPKLLGAPHGP